MDPADAGMFIRMLGAQVQPVTETATMLGSIIGTAVAGGTGAIVSLIIQAVTGLVHRKRQERYAAEVIWYDVERAQGAIAEQVAAREGLMNGHVKEVPYVRPQLADPSLWQLHRPLIRRGLQPHEANLLDDFYSVVKEFNTVTEIEYISRMRGEDVAGVSSSMRLELICTLHTRIMSVRPVARRLARIAQIRLPKPTEASAV